MKQLKKAFAIGAAKPFNFALASFLYVIFSILFALATLGVFLVYFFLAAIFSIHVSSSELPTQIVICILAVVFVYFEAGIGAAFALAIKKALGGQKTALVEFYGNILKGSTKLFIMTVIRSAIMMLFIGPVVTLYLFVLKDYPFMDVLAVIISLLFMFIIWVCTSPAFVFVSLGKGVRSSFKLTYEMLRKEHVNYLMQYIVFIFISLINLVPVLNIFTYFFFYPISYGSLVLLADKEGSYAPE